ncbi:MAG: MATE family efflux transporter, partial [Clostridia bacterium]|nr:MATE family efflux transporter [Clostridia bacterium]
MNIRLSDHFTYKKLLRFTLPSILMMIFTSTYSAVDGFFVSNFAGNTAFAALNLIYPIIMILATVGFMLGTGGTALVSKTLGEGNDKKANALFSMFTYLTFGLGVLFGVLGIVFIRPLAIMLGATEELLKPCMDYATILLIALPFFV